MRICIISSNYPDHNKPYANMFVHRRAVEYQKIGHDVSVFVPSAEKKYYEFEGITVYFDSSKVIAEEILAYDVASVHLLGLRLPYMENDGYKIFESIINNKMPLMWHFHGNESLTNKYYGEPMELKTFFHDYYVIPKTRKLVKRVQKSVQPKRFIFPSLWLKKTASSILKTDMKPYLINPSGIDTERFKFTGYKYDKVCNMLSIRSFNMWKYANDISIRAMKHLPDFNLTIIGQGRYVEHCKKLIQKERLQNVKIKEGSIPHEQINKVHSQYGIFLAPSRMDTQGVSTIEAMASGLPVVTTNIQGIPEFVKHDMNGMLAEYDKSDEIHAMNIAREALMLKSNRKLYNKITRNANKTAKAYINRYLCSNELREMERMLEGDKWRRGD